MNIEIIRNSENQYEAYILEKDVQTVTKYLTEEAGCSILDKRPGGQRLSFGPKFGLTVTESREPLICTTLSNPLGDELVDKLSQKFNLQVWIRDENRWDLSSR